MVIILYINSQSMKSNKAKGKEKQKDKITDKFKKLCLENTKRQPPTYLTNFLKEKSVEFDLDVFQADDLPFVEYFFALPITKIHVFSNPNAKKPNPGRPFYEITKFKELMTLIGKAIEEVETIKSLTFEKFPLAMKFLNLLKPYLKQTTKLRQLVIKECSITDEHIESLKGVLAENQSLVIVDFSHNALENVGGMMGKILSEHSRRRNDIVWFASLRGEKPEEDLSKKGICEINLQFNQIDDQSVHEMMNFLKDDNWTKCLNLRNNRLTIEGVKNFALLMKKNTSLISLDLRDNPGFTKEYSLYIYKKLKKNLELYKEKKKELLVNTQNKDITLISEGKAQKYKSLEQSRRKSLQPRPYHPSNQSKLEYSLQNNLLPLSGKNLTSPNESSCPKCKEKTFRLLKVEKKNLDLQLQLKKLKQIILTKNIDISAIIPNTSYMHASLSFQKNNSENEEDMLARMEQIMMELTKIMESVEGQQQTQINMTNALSNAHSLSNTIPIFVQPEELEEFEIENQNQV